MFFKSTVFLLTILSSAFLEAKAIKNYEGDLSFRHNNVFGNLDSIKGNTHFFDANFKYDYKKPFVDMEGKFDISLRYNDADFLMFSIKEAQMTHLGENWEVSYGRLDLNWVEADKVWGLGKINNRVNFDSFNPGQEGLVGARAKLQISSILMLDVYGSFIHIPELNPPLNIDKDSGSITSKSPWAALPSTTFQNGSLSVNLKYNVEAPKVKDVVLNESYGLNLRLSPYKQLHITSFFLRKPENNLSNTASLTLIDSTSAVVDVNPRIFYHTLYGGQITYAPSSFLDFYASYYVSIPGDKPLDDNDFITFDIDKGLTLEKFEEEYVALGMRYKSSLMKLHLGFLNRTSDFDRGTLTKVPRWSQAMNLSGTIRFSRSFFGNFDFKYDTLVYDRLYQASLTYQAANELDFKIGAQIIGSPDIGEGFWVTFRDNDSFFAEAKYKF